jgi:hypothetical protein
MLAASRYSDEIQKSMVDSRLYTSPPQHELPTTQKKHTKQSKEKSSKNIMFDLRYTDDIQNRVENYVDPVTARTLDELPFKKKKTIKTMVVNPPPQHFDVAFPKTLSNSKELDEFMLQDLHLNFLEAEHIFQQKLRASSSFYNDELLYIDEERFIQFNFLNDSGWYQECPQCFNNYINDCSDDYKCSCH